MGKTKRARPSKSKKSKSKNRKTKRKKDKYYKSRFRSMRGRPSKILELKSRTPEFNMKLKESLLKSTPKKVSKTPKKDTTLSNLMLTISPTHSYSPPVNQALQTLQDLTPNADIFACEKNGLIRIKNGSKYECISYLTDSKELQKIMLKNLNVTSNKINFKNILPPRQSLGNCWFNCYFMCFFISDKGRKFFRYFRTIMITGKFSDGKTIPKGIKEPFLLLNYFIEASLIGTRDPKRFASVMDTNVLINNIGIELRRDNWDSDFPQMKEAGNPISAYRNIINYLGQDDMSMNLVATTRWLIAQNKLSPKYKDSQKIPDLIYIKQGDNQKEFPHLNKEITLTIKEKPVKYKLDSACVRDENKSHFTAYITGNGRQYAFDGESFSTLIPFEWKSKINSDIPWKFEDISKSRQFNFRSCAAIFLYYRI
jgi:hypothetical protein